MIHRHVESPDTIRARFRSKLARSRRNNPTYRFDGPHDPLTPAQPAPVVEQREAAPQPATEPQTIVSALDLLRADMNNSGHATRQHVDALGGRLDRMAVSSEGHWNVHQQQTETINNSINALDLSPLQAIPPIETNLADLCQSTLDIANITSNMQDDLSLLTARGRTFMSKGLTTLGKISTRLGTLDDNMQTLSAQSSSEQDILLGRFDTLATDFAANARSMDEVNRQISALHNVVESFQTQLHDNRISVLERINAQSTDIGSTYAELLESRKLLVTIQARILATPQTNTSLEELELLKKAIEGLSPLQTLADALTEVSKTLAALTAQGVFSNAAWGTDIGRDLQSELDRMGEGSSTGVGSPIQEKAYTEEANLHESETSGDAIDGNAIDWREASSMLRSKQDGKLEDYRVAQF